MTLFLGLLLAVAAPCVPQKPAEPPRTLAFPSHPHLLLSRAGTALRQRFGTAFYASTLYVDLHALRARLPKGGKLSVAAIAHALASGEVPVLFRTRFLQDASGAANLRFLHDALRSRWPGTFDPAAPDLAPFNAFFGTSISLGMEDEVAFDGRGGLVLRRGKEPETRLHHPPLALAFLRMYFGDSPLDPVFRDSLLLELPARMDAEGLTR